MVDKSGILLTIAIFNQVVYTVAQQRSVVIILVLTSLCSWKTECFHSLL